MHGGRQLYRARSRGRGSPRQARTGASLRSEGTTLAVSWVRGVGVWIARPIARYRRGSEAIGQHLPRLLQSVCLLKPCHFWLKSDFHVQQVEGERGRVRTAEASGSCVGWVRVALFCGGGNCSGDIGPVVRPARGRLAETPRPN